MNYVILWFKRLKSELTLRVKCWVYHGDKILSDVSADRYIFLKKLTLGNHFDAINGSSQISLTLLYEFFIGGQTA